MVSHNINLAKEGFQSSSISSKPQYDKMRQFILRIKIPLESDYVYDYKRTGKIVYEIRLN